MIHLVSDSSCDLPDEVIKELNLGIAPLNILVGNQSYKERVDISPLQFYEKMAQAKDLPKTSQPSPESFGRLFEDLTKTGEVLCLTISSGLSGTYQAAKLAAESFGPRVGVFDTKGGSMGHGLLILRAAQLIKAGHSMATILKDLSEQALDLNILIILNTLENIVKGGRLSRFQGTMGKLLDIRAILKKNQAGSVDLFEKVRGQKRLLRAVCAEIKKSNKIWPETMVGITHFNNPRDAHFFKDFFEEELKVKGVLINYMGATMATYAGEGGLIISF